MKILEAIKDSVIQEFTGTISVGDILLSLLTAFLISIFIIYVYKKTYVGVIYSKAFSLSLILISMVTAIIIRTINSNLSLSLGMVGALSIVRFRTAIKEPIDTVYIFWAISVGIMAGAGIYLVALISSLGIGLFYFISYMMGFKVNTQYLLILKYNINDEKEILEKVTKLGKTKLKSKSVTKEVVEISYEVEVKNGEEVLQEFEKDDKIINASIISYQNDFGA